MVWLTALLALAPGLGPMVGLGGLVVFVAVALAVSVRRLHDRGKSGWWLLAMYLPLFVLGVFEGLTELSPGEPNVVLSLLSLAFSIWALVELGCLKGTVGSNKFGPDPLNPSTAEVFS